MAHIIRNVFFCFFRHDDNDEILKILPADCCGCNESTVIADACYTCLYNRLHNCCLMVVDNRI